MRKEDKGAIIGQLAEIVKEYAPDVLCLQEYGQMPPHVCYHECFTPLMQANGYVDLLIPRGGKGLIKACIDNAKVPCIETGTGICHIYVDESSNIEKALNIINNAKTGMCPMENKFKDETDLNNIYTFFMNQK